jgi:thioredoxin 1
MSTHVQDVTDANFQQMVIEASKAKPVFIDFWAEWCTPCKAFSPIVDSVAEEMSDKMTFLKMDTDANPNVAMNMDVMAIPTFMIFKDGALAYRDAGFRSKDDLTEILHGILGNSKVVEFPSQDNGAPTV